MLKICTLVCLSVVALVSGHGMLMDPPNRSSLWRVDPTAIVNYQDTQNFCGGAWTQHGVNGGKCGVCGDNWSDAQPRNNENTGKYGTGKIVKEYKAGSVITVESHITANHLGNIQYHVCKIQDSKKPESGEECFVPVAFEDGSAKLKVLSSHKVVRSKLRLPKGLTCQHCTLRWTYTAGNSWGVCDDGTGAMGCGNQETFRSCSDIKIV